MKDGDLLLIKLRLEHLEVAARQADKFWKLYLWRLLILKEVRNDY